MSAVFFPISGMTWWARAGLCVSRSQAPRSTPSPDGLKFARFSLMGRDERVFRTETHFGTQISSPATALESVYLAYLNCRGVHLTLSWPFALLPSILRKSRYSPSITSTPTWSPRSPTPLHLGAASFRGLILVPTFSILWRRL